MIRRLLSFYYHYMMNTLELFDNIEEMTKISQYAEDHELTVNYVIEEFVIDNQLIEVNK